jgi:hypothetical protein
MPAVYELRQKRIFCLLLRFIGIGKLNNQHQIRLMRTGLRITSSGDQENDD